MDTCRANPRHMDCGNSVKSASPEYPAFKVCLPFGRALYWDGQGMRLMGEAVLADGVYGQITVVDGCITNAELQPVCEYTPAPCTPAVTPCGDSSSSVSLQPGTDNLLNFDAAGRLGAQIHYSAGTGISISGSGTTSDPLLLSADFPDQESTYIQGGMGPVTVSGTGVSSDPYEISHGTSGIAAGTYGNITVDDYGHIIAVDDSGGAITSITDIGGLKIQQTGTTVQLGLPTQAASGSFRFGGHDVTLDVYGRVTGVSQGISLSAQVIDGARYNIAVNELGSITGLELKTDPVTHTVTEFFTGTRETTAMQFTTTETGYFKITYEGNLGTGSANNNLYGLPATWALYVDGRRVPAYARSSCVVPTVSGAAGVPSYALTHVLALTDGYYAAAEHTVELRRTDGGSFTDNGFLVVQLTGRP